MTTTVKSARWASRWPRKLPASAYDDAREAYLDRLFATGDVVAAYQMGGVGAPGLSDLDLIVVCRDPIRADLNKIADIAALGGHARYTFMHSQFLVNEEVFRLQRALFLGSSLRHVRGVELPIVDFPSDVEEVLRLSFHVEMMLRRLTAFARVLMGQEVPTVRPLLAAVHSVCFNVKGASAWTDVGACAGYPEEVMLLRRDWFDLTPEGAFERLLALTGRAAGVLTRLLEGLRPAAARLQGGAGAGSVHALEIHEVYRYGPHATSVALRRNPLARAVPRAMRGWRPLKPHLAPLAETRVPGEFFVFPWTLRRALLDLGELALARRVQGTPAEAIRPAVEAAMGARARALHLMRGFARRNRLRRISFLVPSGWQVPYPWQFRLKARVLEAAGLAR